MENTAKISVVLPILCGSRVTVENELFDHHSIHSDDIGSSAVQNASSDCDSMEYIDDNGTSVQSTPTSPAISECDSMHSPAGSICESESEHSPSEQQSMHSQQSDILNTSIYHNSNLSLVTSLLLIMSFALKHNLTDAALQDLLQLISYFVPTPNTCITSLYSFKKFFATTQLKSNRIYYCEVCKAPIENMLTSHCPSCKHTCSLDSKSFFLNICILEQIKNLFSRPGFFTSIQHRLSRKSGDYLTDVYDGRLYRNLSKPGGFLSYASNLSFQWNTDGVPLFSSSSFSMWPLYLKINELPHRLRNCISNKILAGVWFGTTKPTINTFLKPLCDTMKSLFFDGIVVHPPELPNPITCKAIILSGTCDIPAKSTALNMVGHNGFFGCPYCEQPGKTLSVGNGHVHVYPYIASNPTGPARTHSKVEKCAKESFKNGERVQGINPPGSCLLTLPHYDIVKGTVNLWFDSSYHAKAWSCSRLLSTADERLTSIHPPSLISRAPRSLNERKYWKASEYRSFLLYYSLPVMLGLLPTTYYEHYTLFCEALFILNSDAISPQSLKQANKMLHKFYRVFSSLYGERYLTFNMHQLLHLTDCVTQLGPLHTFSCFDHEHCNGTLAKMIHSNCGVDKQLSYTFSCLQSMCALAANKDVQMEYLDDVPLLYSRMPSREVQLLNFKDVLPLENHLARLIQPYISDAPPPHLQRYGRLKLNSKIYHAEIYERPTKFNNTVISFNMPSPSNEEQEFFGIISFFCSLHKSIFAIVKCFSDVVPLTSTNHVFVCNKIPASFVVVPVTNINRKIVYMSFSDVANSVYVAKFPNVVESD